MSTMGATVCFGFIILLVSTSVLATSPPAVDHGNPTPPSCPKNEVHRCKTPCPPDRCIILYAAFDCIANQTCVDGCYCKEGYLRIGRNGPCVPKDQCPPIDCVEDSNARRGCGDKCGKTCADYDKHTICPKRPCKNDGCDCKERYVHDTNQDKCVLPKDCTKPCKPHERWSPCLMGECVAKTCDDLGKPIACPAIAIDPCPGGCICDYGFVKAKNGSCIDAKTCPTCNGDPNAEIGCGNPCGKTCASLYVNKSEIICPQYCEANGCDCKKGYLLDTNAKPPKCVLVKDCPKPPNQCGRNEEYYCGPSCPNSEASCSNPSPPICINKRCELKCFCKKGYVRDTKNGNVCIPAEKCHHGNPTPPSCPKNEVHRCKTPCPPDRCITLYAAFDCIANQTCVDGCYCKEGYLRIGRNGPCVPKDQCPPIDCVEDSNARRGCGDKCGKTCADYDKNPICPKRPCKNDGCDCKERYVHDTNQDKCVLPKDCTKPCKPHERWSPCLMGECVAKTCDDLGKPIACPAIAIDPCPGGCICDYGFVKAKNGSCIDAKTCPTCDGDPYAEIGCGNPCGKTCASLYVNKSEIICPQYCEVNGCDCKKGYLLDTNAKPPKCVLVKDCPKPPNQCGRNEEYYCGPSCPNSEASCSNPSPPICINKRCELKCFCRKGYVRDTKNGNVCIPAEKCPKNCTNEHERYTDCYSGQCGPKSCDDLGKSISCPGRTRDPCPGGCICEEGYLRDINGNCIKIEDCPPKPCSGNQTWMSPCNAPCPYPNCPRDDKPPRPCVEIKPCYPGCQCKLNYLRNTKGECNLALECPRVNCTRQNEEWDSCPSACLAESCDDVNNQPTTCNTLIWLCSPRCVCKKGYFRNKDGLCIPASQCPKYCKDPNASWIGCRSICPGTCQNPKPICISKLVCRPGCQCKKGYVLDKPGDGGKCIKIEKCPVTTTTAPPSTTPAPPKCKANEHWTDCYNGTCKPKTCDELTAPAPCPRVIPPCPGGCICDDGYLRDANGVCIKKENCRRVDDMARFIIPIFFVISTVTATTPVVNATTCKGQNEQYTDCIRNQCTPTTCKEVVKMPYCPPTEPGDCPGGCTCKGGFVRSANGTCIAISDCPEAGTCTEPNQAWTQCAFLCANAYCPKDDQKQPICFLPAGLCHPGCKCKPNYRISKDNKCIPARDCPAVKCTRQNEEYSSCPGNRITSCALLLASSGSSPVASTGTTICNPGCICKKGFYQNDNSTCVPRSQCPTDDSTVPTEKPVPKCPPNEELKLRTACPPDSCDMLYVSVLCTANQPQELMCTCKSGYMRRNTTCVPVDRCLPPECAEDPNAVRGCGNRCGKTCADYKNTTKICKVNFCNLYGCDCKDGYIYDESMKTCVKPEQCTKQCQGPYEEYIDCPAGQCNAKTCDDLVTSPGCPRIRPPCPGGCVCQEGYLRNRDGKCIPKNECPSLQCKKNERWSNCPNGECVPKTCKELGYPVACPDIVGPCAGGCVCKEGFVRNSNGECIGVENCPSCGGDVYAVSGCGNPCGKTCASLYSNQSDLICPQYCEYNACDCKPGYRLLSDDSDPESKKCVPERECPKPTPQCGANEQYYCGSSCPEATCVNPTPPQCVNKKCKLGCFCKKGFVRDSNNNCIQVDKCRKCKGPNERLVSCPLGQCMPKTCKDLITPPGCPRVLPPCPDGCICEEGYLRDDNGKCIKKEQCPKPTCKANETYALCSVKCPDKYCPKVDGPQPVCDPPRVCPPGCICKINYRYDKSGNCILASECPPVNCTDTNAVWDPCPSACLNEQCEAADSPPVTCNTLLLNCNPRCVCKPGHFKHPETGKCVPAKECPNVCKDPNASWKDCRDACAGTCRNTKPMCLNKACSPGCQCNDGYVLSKEGEGGKCVKIETCADYADCPVNQTFVQCTHKCPQVMCPESDQTILCKPPRDCPGGCGCKPYYRYDTDGNCIKASDCSPVECTRPNEEWTCQRPGDWENCEDRYNSPPFWAGDPDDCTPKCACKKGYWRKSYDECVTEDECPPIGT